VIRLLAYAKLNLSLRILGRCPDGFHEIDSLVQTISLADRISVDVTQAGVQVENDAGIPPEKDLTGRAARLLLAEKHDPRGMRIKTEKRIPIGAGLGGGSSDAAAVLWSVNRLTSPLLPEQDLLHLAARLGADVPLFLTGGRMQVCGMGEKITPLPITSRERFLLLIPPVHCQTACVYDHFDELASCSTQTLVGDLLGNNDLEPAALDLYSALAPYRNAVAALPSLYSGMSGSGSAFFAAFSSPETAEASRKKLSLSFPEAKIHLCYPTRTGYHVEGRH